MKDEVDVSIIGYGKDLERTLNLASSLGLDINVLQKLSHCKLGVYYWDSDVVIDQFTVGALGMTSLESIACGRPVVTYVSSEYAEHKDFPLRDVKDAGEVKRAIKTASPELWEKQYQYLLNNHHPEKIARKILSVYSNL
jgi:glycosyltransferase involved in cell wall biosynthesis